MNEHVILVALVVETDETREGAMEMAQDRLHPLLQSQDPTSPIDSWWIAEDDRSDGSDCDSAVFVKTGAQPMSARLLALAGLTHTHNVVERSGGQFSGDAETDWDQVQENLRACFGWTEVE